MAATITTNKDGDWLASLARQSTASDNKAKPSNKRKRKGNNSAVDESRSVPLTKAQRIERREQKRIEREERKRLAEEIRQRRIEKKKNKLQKINGTNTKRSAPTHHVHEKSTKLNNSCMTSISKQALTQLSTTLNATVSSYAQQNQLATLHSHPKQRTKKKKNQEDKDTTQHQQIIITNGLPSEPKGKATRSSTLRPQSKEIQPRTRDYNGQGLVRPSLYIPFDDPSFIPKFELEFEEHIPGFFGKSKTKAAKKQSDEKMLWRRCLKAKEEEEGEKGEGDGSGKNKKKRKKKGIGGMDNKIAGMMKQGIM